jgi:D-alanyl-D-alanine carboxypeptidase
MKGVLLRASAILLAAAVVGAVPGALAGGPRFDARVKVIGPALRASMTSWRAGCPVPVSRLRLLTLDHWGFDGRERSGRLIVHSDYARDVVRVFRALHRARFPIRRLELVERYGSDDDRSMAADNTSGFNCRGVARSGAWSEHAYGRAIDVNPLENPEVRGSVVSPPRGVAYLDRSRWKRGMIHRGDAVVRAFAAIGWEWGGDWRSLKDYQHFSATGR